MEDSNRGERASDIHLASNPNGDDAGGRLTVHDTGRPITEGQLDFLIQLGR